MFEKPLLWDLLELELELGLGLGLGIGIGSGLWLGLACIVAKSVISSTDTSGPHHFPPQGRSSQAVSVTLRGRE